MLDREENGKQKIVVYFLGLSSLIEDKGRHARVPTAYLNMKGEGTMIGGGEDDGESDKESVDLMFDPDEGEQESVEANFSLEDVKNGNVNIIVLHAEVKDTQFGQELFNYLEENELVSYFFVDEWQKNIHWQSIRRKMFTLVPRLMLQFKVPIVLSTATIRPAEVTFAKEVWGVSNSVTIQAGVNKCPDTLIK